MLAFNYHKQMHTMPSLMHLQGNSTPMELAQSKQHKCPSILFTASEVFLVVDCTVLFSCPPEKAAFVLLGSYYVFHIGYLPQHTGLFTMLERIHEVPTTLKEVPKTVKALETVLKMK